MMCYNFSCHVLQIQTNGGRTLRKCRPLPLGWDLALLVRFSPELLENGAAEAAPNSLHAF